jgi:hypothetical protein
VAAALAKHLPLKAVVNPVFLNQSARDRAFTILTILIITVFSSQKISFNVPLTIQGYLAIPTDPLPYFRNRNVNCSRKPHSCGPLSSDSAQ